MILLFDFQFINLQYKNIRIRMEHLNIPACFYLGGGVQPVWMSWHSLGNLNRELWNDKARVGTLLEKLGYALYNIIIFHLIYLE